MVCRGDGGGLQAVISGDAARLTAERRDLQPAPHKQLKAMKTVEETKTGLPSFETDWRKNTETERQTCPGGTNWASERFHRMLQSSVLESTWHGFQGYDSPLAGL